MAKEIKLPQISEGVDSAEVAEVMVAAGDSISEGDSMITVETDKASVEVPCTTSGKIKEVKVKEGSTINVGDVILILEESASGGEDTEEDATSDEKEQQPVEEENDTDDKEKVTEKDEKENSGGSDEQAEGNDEGEPDGKDEAGDEEREVADTDGGNQEAMEEKEPSADENQGDEKESAAVAAAPSVRRLARELGVDIRSVKGSGAQGRISEADVKSYKSIAGNEASEGEKPAADSGLPDFSKWGNIETQKLSSIRKAIATSTGNSWSQIPHVTQFDQADVTDLETYRKKMQEKAGDVKITVTAILAKIAVSALQRFPTFNASLDLPNQEIILKHYYHIGLAVDTEKGLLVPVIKDADKKSIYDIAAEITELSEKARDQKLMPEEMQGGTFVVSNLGGIGGTNFTPIVYHPQVAILGVSRASTQPVYIDGTFQPRQILPLSLSYDHRVIDGAAGAKFLRWICDAMEDPLKAMLGS